MSAATVPMFLAERQYRWISICPSVSAVHQSGGSGGSERASTSPSSRPHVCTVPLEANIVADLAGGASTSLRQKQPAVGTYANLVDGLAGAGRWGAAGGLPLGQPHQANSAGIQRDLYGAKGRGRAGEVRNQDWVWKEDDGQTVDWFQKMSYSSERP